MDTAGPGYVALLTSAQNAATVRVVKQPAAGVREAVLGEAVFAPSRLIAQVIGVAAHHLVSANVGLELGVVRGLVTSQLVAGVRLVFRVDQRALVDLVDLTHGDLNLCGSPFVVGRVEDLAARQFYPAVRIAVVLCGKLIICGGALLLLMLLVHFVFGLIVVLNNEQSGTHSYVGVPLTPAAALRVPHLDMWFWKIYGGAAYNMRSPHMICGCRIQYAVAEYGIRVPHPICGHRI